MKARKRYLLLIVCIAFLTLLYLGFVRLKATDRDGDFTIPFINKLLSFSSSTRELINQRAGGNSKASSHHQKAREKTIQRHSYLDGHDVDISSPFQGSEGKYSRKGAIWRPIQETKSAFFPGFNG